MKQVEFEKLLSQIMEIPVKNVQLLVAAWIVVMRQRLRIGDNPNLPRFGKWYVTIRQGKNIYNPYYETVIHYSAKNVVKFKAHLWAGKEIAPSWRPYLSVNGVRIYPQSDIANMISAVTSVDLLICNAFVYNLVDQLIVQMDADEKIAFNNFGTFKLYHNSDKNGRNPYTNEPLYVPGRNKIIFRASKSLRELVN